MKRIGFKHYDEHEENSSAENESSENISISSSHAEVIENINNLASIIAGEEFVSLDALQKIALVKQLTLFSSINAELSLLKGI